MEINESVASCVSETYKRKPGISIENYISEMKARWQRAEAAGLTIIW